MQTDWICKRLAAKPCFEHACTIRAAALHSMPNIILCVSSGNTVILIKEKMFASIWLITLVNSRGDNSIQQDSNHLT
jgi:hypothetical protein